MADLKDMHKMRMWWKPTTYNPELSWCSSKSNCGQPGIVTLIFKGKRMSFYYDHSKRTDSIPTAPKLAIVVNDLIRACRLLGHTSGCASWCVCMQVCNDNGAGISAYHKAILNRRRFAELLGERLYDIAYRNASAVYTLLENAEVTKNAEVL